MSCVFVIFASSVGNYYFLIGASKGLDMSEMTITLLFAHRNPKIKFSTLVFLIRKRVHMH